MANPTVRKVVTMPPDLNQRIEDFRFQRRVPTETEALRQLLEKGLDAASREEKAA